MKPTLEPIKRYLGKHAEHCPEYSSLAPPSDSLKLCVVIPATGERDRIQTVLDSLQLGSTRLSEAEVIVVVNNARDAPGQRLHENLATIQDLKNYKALIRILPIDRSSFGKAYPASTAGVGAARRTGMDLALRRLVQVGNIENGAIACLDADSPTSSGYIDTLLSLFATTEQPFAAVCRYHHPIPTDDRQARSIIAYELWLRYLELCMRLCAAEYAVSAIGSCLVVSVLGYARSDGMPRRKAGEDFHFLQKIIKVRARRRIVPHIDATVFPSSRVSDRVPFGTGHAMHRCAQVGPDRYLFVEPPLAFMQLRHFFKALPDWYHNPNAPIPGLSNTLHAFLESKNAYRTFERLRVNAPNPENFVLSIKNWLGSLQLIRYARYLRSCREGVWIGRAIMQILKELQLNTKCIDPSWQGIDTEDRHTETLHAWLVALRNIQEYTCLQMEYKGM